MRELWQKYLLAGLALLLLFFLQFLDLLSLSFGQQLANQVKVWQRSWLLQVQAPVLRVRQMWQLAARLEDLQYRYSEAAAELAQLENLRQENQELRRLLENTDRSYQQVIISTPLVSLANTYVAAGSNQGVQVGAAVLARGSLLGLVEEVQPRQARVLLLAQLRQQGLVALTTEGAKGLLIGDGKDILLTELGQELPLEVGQLVYTVANPGLPAGLLVGKISHIRQDNPSLATRTAVVEQLVNFYEVAVVEIQ